VTVVYFVSFLTFLAGIVLQRHVLEFFMIARLAPPDEMSVKCARRQYLDKEGNVTRKEDYEQRMTSWSVLYKAIKDAFPPDRWAPPTLAPSLHAKTKMGTGNGLAWNYWLVYNLTDASPWWAFA
jgi:hypothetical protein